jgi:hypothetical protein
MASLRSRTSRSGSLIRCCSAVVTPGRWLASTWACNTHHRGRPAADSSTPWFSVGGTPYFAPLAKAPQSALTESHTFSSQMITFATRSL